MTKRLLSFTSVAGALLLLGCSGLDNCPDAATKAIEIKDGTTDKMALFYESASWTGEPRDEEPRKRHPFPAKTCLRFLHELGATPEVVTTYLSFEADGSDVTENAGNQGRIKCVDDHEIVIKNDTCEEDFFIRVAATASGSSHSEACVNLEADGCQRD
jgi:hypothetical protein